SSAFFYEIAVICLLAVLQSHVPMYGVDVGWEISARLHRRVNELHRITCHWVRPRIALEERGNLTDDIPSDAVVGVGKEFGGTIPDLPRRVGRTAALRWRWIRQ